MNRAMDYGKLIADFIEDQHTQERPADLSEYADPVGQEWSVVEYDIAPQDGLWVVYLLFIDVDNPASFTRIPVKACRTRKLAEITAGYLRRARSMDTIITFRANADELGCSLN
ncbi:MAG TPA: hypothetical protein PKC76_19185 [Saprospiraceae bacterium]|nr:hypothetical protein [Saprospiraceae bacterium]HMP26261.1 hypothetical protein [Saprospiraceae bacterium]